MGGGPLLGVEVSNTPVKRSPRHAEVTGDVGYGLWTICDRRVAGTRDRLKTGRFRSHRGESVQLPQELFSGEEDADGHHGGSGESGDHAGCRRACTRDHHAGSQRDGITCHVHQGSA